MFIYVNVYVYKCEMFIYVNVHVYISKMFIYFCDLYIIKYFLHS